MAPIFDTTEIHNFAPEVLTPENLAPPVSGVDLLVDVFNMFLIVIPLFLLSILLTTMALFVLFFGRPPQAQDEESGVEELDEDDEDNEDNEPDGFIFLHRETNIEVLFVTGPDGEPEIVGPPPDYEAPPLYEGPEVSPPPYSDDD